MARRPSGIRLARNVRLDILRRAREIISDRKRWTTGRLRSTDLEPRYCVLGAVERAAYDLGYAVEDPGNSFDQSDWGRDGGSALGYRLGSEISLNRFAQEKYGGENIWNVNDGYGHEATLRTLDEYIVEVEEGRAREPEVE